MKADRALGKRIESVLFAFMSQIGTRVTLADFGMAVAKAEGRAHPYTAATVNGWFQGISEPRLSVFRALGEMSGQHPSVIAFGDVPLERDEEYERGEDAREAAPPEKRHDKTTPAKSRRAKPA